MSNDSNCLNKFPFFGPSNMKICSRQPHSFLLLARYDEDDLQKAACLNCTEGCVFTTEPKDVFFPAYITSISDVQVKS